MNKMTSVRWIIIPTVVVALLTTIASLYGLFSPLPYALETANWRLQGQGQDIGNLLAVIVLITSAVLAVKGSIKSYLVWQGSLLYLLYAYVVYAFAVHLNSLFLIYVAILGITFFTLVRAMFISEPINIARSGARKFASVTLIGVGCLFALLWLSEIIPAMVSGNTPKSISDAGLIVNPVHVMDLSVVLPAFMLTGYLSLKNNNFGLRLVAPWLAFSVLMGSSIIATMLLMLTKNTPDAIAPLVIVSAVVACSMIALVLHMQKLETKA